MATVLNSCLKGCSHALGVIAVIYITDIGYWGCRDSLKKLLRFYTLVAVCLTTYYFFTAEQEEEAVPVPELPLDDPPPQEPPPIDCPAPQDPLPPLEPPPIVCPQEPRPQAPPPAAPDSPYCVQCGFLHPGSRHAW